MQFKNIVAIVSSVALGQAYIIPAGLENGIYAVRVNETGHLHPYPIDSAHTPPPAGRAVRRASLSTRDQNGVRESRKYLVHTSLYRRLPRQHLKSFDGVGTLMNGRLTHVARRGG
jgi:hypothetical protein